MQEDKPSTDIDPHIQAFEVLSDRISNLEDAVAILIESARAQESTTYGTLNHRALGLPCATVRHRADERMKTRAPGAPEHVSALIVKFPDITFEHILNLRCGVEREDISVYFSPTETLAILRAQEDLGDKIVSSEQVKILSCHHGSIAEGLQRLVDREKKRYSALGGDVIVRPFDWTDYCAAFLIIQPRVYGTPHENALLRAPFRESPFQTICVEMLQLFQGLAGQPVRKMETFQVCPFAASAFVDYWWWQSNDKTNSARHRRVQIQIEKLRSLRTHVFFEEEAHMGDAIEDDI